MTLKIGLTGSIGAGKSTVAAIFWCMGIPVYDADAEAKKFLADPDVLEQLRASFPEAVFDARGAVVNVRLAEYVFRTPAALAFLNSMIHPRVRSDFEAWAEVHGSAPYLVQEAAILIESGFYREFDRIVVVTAPEALRISRVMARDGVPEEKIRQRMVHQMDEAEKLKFADYVVVNDDRHSLIMQVIEIHHSIHSN